MGYKHILPLTCCLSLYISAQTYRETGCCICVSRVSACWVFLCIYIHAHRGNRLWYLGIQGISLLSSPYISINAHRETGCGIWVSRVSACWVFLYTSIHTYRETSSGIWVSRVSVCCPLRIYLYTYTEKQVVVSGYLGYQPTVLSVYIYTHVQRNKLYLGI